MGITILQLTEKTCRWPIGHPGDDGFCYCGEPPIADKPYCADHCTLAYNPADDRPQKTPIIWWSRK